MIQKGVTVKLEEGSFRLDIKDKFFTIKVMRLWNILLKETVNTPSLEVFKAKLDGALRNLI